MFGLGRIGEVVGERLGGFNVRMEEYEGMNEKDNEDCSFVNFDELV